MLHQNLPARRRGAVALSRKQGFTLVELVVVLVVLGVLLGLAIPSFTYVNNNSRLTGPANDLVAAIQLARVESIRQNARVVLCTSANGTSCSGSAQSAGWMVFGDTDRDNVVDAGEVVLLVHSVPAPTTVYASDSVAGGVIQFRSDGLARNSSGALLNGQVRICLPVTKPAENVRDIAIQSGGRVRTTRLNNAGACTKPA